MSIPIRIFSFVRNIFIALILAASLVCILTSKIICHYDTRNVNINKFSQLLELLVLTHYLIRFTCLETLLAFLSRITDGVSMNK